MEGQVAIDISEEMAEPGVETVDVDVSFASSAVEVAGTQNDIVYDPMKVSLENKFSCKINPDIGLAACAGPDDPCKSLSGALGDCPGPVGCAEGMKYFRGIVVALDNVNVIPDGVLYTCTFGVVAEGNFAALLENENAGSSDPAGGTPETIACDGQIKVGAEEPTATPTATEVPPEPTDTPIPPPTATRTRVPDDGKWKDDDGCQISAPANAGTGWLLLIPVIGLFWLRRRSR
jgi:MYXO-CTERM domain-containing protein